MSTMNKSSLPELFCKTIENGDTNKFYKIIQDPELKVKFQLVIDLCFHNDRLDMLEEYLQRHWIPDGKSYDYYMFMNMNNEPVLDVIERVYQSKTKRQHYYVYY